MRSVTLTSFLGLVLVTAVIIPLSFAFALLLGPYVLAQNTTTPTGVTSPAPTKPTAALPIVKQLWPQSGGTGQYVTLEGSDFGFDIGRVYFLRRGQEVDASVDFPSQCQNYWWRNSYVVVRVPDKLEAGQYQIKLRRADGVVTEPSSFTVTNASPTPGICALITDNGPAGVPIKIYGDHFGAKQGRVVIGTVDVTVKDGDWNDGFISAMTPTSGLTSGRLRIIDANKTLSNPAFFTVGRCSVLSCGQGQSCCGDGSCRPSGSCEDKPKLCTYGWSFSTGSYLGIGEACNKNEQCLSSVCDAGKCVQGSKVIGAACSFDQECSKDLLCKGGFCASSGRAIGQACKISNECASQSCVAGLCTQGKKSVGAQCSASDQCSSKNCVKGICAQTVRPISVDHITPCNVKDIPRNAAPSVTFNQLVDTTTIPACVSISPVMAGTWAFYTVGTGEDAKTVAELRPKATLASSASYTFAVKENCVKPLLEGTGVASGASCGFTSGTGVAPIDSLHLYVDGALKSRDIFTSLNDSHDYRLELDAGGSVVNPDDPSISVDWSISPEIATIHDSASNLKDERVISPLSKTGKATLTVTVSQTYQVGGVSKKTDISTSFEIENDFCKNVWEYFDPRYQFDWSYCWDTGVTGSSVLPVLAQSPQTVQRSGLFETEYLFSFQPPIDSETVRNTDAISVRVIKNDELYSPQLWYFKKGPGSGNPKYALVDSFQGITDDQGGTYVSTVRGDGKSYILFITTNSGASKDTQAVLAQLLKRIHLANHIQGSTLNCATPGVDDRACTVRRDLLRTADINDIASWLKDYSDRMCQNKNADGSCVAPAYPRLESGSYLKGQTMSGWPSWQGTLGNLLGRALPVDPYPGTSGIDCTLDSSGKSVCFCSGLRAGNNVAYDPATCFAASASKPFYFDTVERAIDNDRVHAYSYTFSGASYRLCTHLEHHELLSLPVDYCKGP